MAPGMACNDARVAGHCHCKSLWYGRWQQTLDFCERRRGSRSTAKNAFKQKTICLWSRELGVLFGAPYAQAPNANIACINFCSKQQAWDSHCPFPLYACGELVGLNFTVLVNVGASHLTGSTINASTLLVPISTVRTVFVRCNFSWD